MATLHQLFHCLAMARSYIFPEQNFNFSLIRVENNACPRHFQKKTRKKQASPA